VQPLLYVEGDSRCHEFRREFPNPQSCFTVLFLQMTRLYVSALSLVVLILLAEACSSLKTTQQPSPADLVDVQSINPRIRIELRYATPYNFTKRQLYPSGKRCFLRRSAAEKLDKVQQELETLGLGLKIYDGYRPLSVQKAMWAVVPDENYVANPAKGSRHNRGAAVDITLVRSDGSEVEMPTPFDDFTEKAHLNYAHLPDSVRRNRELLVSVMEKHGFKSLPTEWWHFDELGWERYEILDVDTMYAK